MEKALNERLALEEAEFDGHPNQVNNLKQTLQYYAPYKNLLPIPNEEIALNPKLTQNAEYN